MNNEQYWEDRHEQYQQSLFKKLSKREEKLLKQMYQMALEEVLDTMRATLSKSEYNDLIQGMTQFDLQRHHSTLNYLEANLQGNVDALNRLELLKNQPVFTRLDSLLIQIDAELLVLAKEQHELMEDTLINAYVNQVEFDNKELDAMGVSGTFTEINHSIVKGYIYERFYGEMFSDRIWYARDILARESKKIMAVGAVQGKGIDKMSRELAKVMNNSFKNSKRLIRTETANVISKATVDSYKQRGVRKYRWLAEPDACSHCSSLDGKEFDVNNAQVGKNLTPKHPNCKCTIVPVIK